MIGKTIGEETMNKGHSIGEAIETKTEKVGVADMVVMIDQDAQEVERTTTETMVVGHLKTTEDLPIVTKTEALTGGNPLEVDVATTNRETMASRGSSTEVVMNVGTSKTEAKTAATKAAGTSKNATTNAEVPLTASPQASRKRTTSTRTRT